MCIILPVVIIVLFLDRYVIILMGRLFVPIVHDVISDCLNVLGLGRILVSDGRRVVDVSGFSFNCLRSGRALPKCPFEHGCSDF